MMKQTQILTYNGNVTYRNGTVNTRGKNPPIPIWQEDGWAPEPVAGGGEEKKILVSAGNRTQVVTVVIELRCALRFGTLWVVGKVKSESNSNWWRQQADRRRNRKGSEM